MLNTASTSSRLVNGWAVAAALIVAASMAMNANLWTTAFVLVLCLTPGMVMAVRAHHASAPSVAHILRATETPDGRP
jgi:hypothetical protein